MSEGSISVRVMTTADIPAVAKLEQSIFPDPWPFSAFEDALAGPRGMNLVVVDGDSVFCGYLCAQVIADAVHIHNVAVTPPLRRRGLGRLLLEQAESEGQKRGAKSAVLEVRINNTPALAMYDRMGYRCIGRCRRYYRKPVCDALVLYKTLEEEV